MNLHPMGEYERKNSSWKIVFRHFELSKTIVHVNGKFNEKETKNGRRKGGERRKEKKRKFKSEKREKEEKTVKNY